MTSTRTIIDKDAFLHAMKKHMESSLMPEVILQVKKSLDGRMRVTVITQTSEGRFRIEELPMDAGELLETVHAEALKEDHAFLEEERKSGFANAFRLFYIKKQLLFDPPGFDFIRIVEVWDLPPVGYREDAESSHALDVCISYALMRQVKRPFSADDVLDDMSRNIKYVFRSEKAVMTKKKREEERLVLSKNPIMKHLGKASEMLFVREPENSNPETFDFIHVACPLLGVKGDRRAFVEEHYDEIMQAVLWMIGKNRQFQKYGVSVNVLKASVCTVRGMDLMVIFELKEINNS